VHVAVAMESDLHLLGSGRLCSMRALEGAPRKHAFKTEYLSLRKFAIAFKEEYVFKWI